MEERADVKKFLRSILLMICLCITLSLPVYATGTELTVTAPEALPAAGETFEVSISVSGNPGLGAVQLTLAFDRAVAECTEISVGAMLNGALSATNPSAPDGARLAAATTGTMSGGGVLATCTFQVIGNGEPAFALKNVLLSKPDGTNVPIAGGMPDDTEPKEPESEQQAPVQPSPGITTTPGGTATPEVSEKPEPPVEPEIPVKPGGEEEDVSIILPQTFTDVPGSHWASVYIEKAADMGMIRGYSDGSFRPGNQVTRAQFVTMLWRMAGSPESSGKTPFTDIAGINAEFRSAIAWAYERGYINGRTATTFAPSDTLSRQAAMKVLFLYAGGKSGQEVLFSEIYNDRFTDSAGLADWAKTSLYWAVYNELISGTTATTLGATDAATRGQLAKILVNYAEKIGTR